MFVKTFESAHNTFLVTLERHYESILTELNRRIDEAIEKLKDTCSIEVEPSDAKNIRFILRSYGYDPITSAYEAFEENGSKPMVEIKISFAQ